MVLCTYRSMSPMAGKRGGHRWPPPGGYHGTCMLVSRDRRQTSARAYIRLGRGKEPRVVPNIPHREIVSGLASHAGCPQGLLRARGPMRLLVYYCSLAYRIYRPPKRGGVPLLPRILLEYIAVGKHSLCIAKSTKSSVHTRTYHGWHYSPRVLVVVTAYLC